MCFTTETDDNGWTRFGIQAYGTLTLSRGVFVDWRYSFLLPLLFVPDTRQGFKPYEESP